MHAAKNGFAMPSTNAEDACSTATPKLRVQIKFTGDVIHAIFTIVVNVTITEKIVPF
jgi:hypothetical protein